MECETVIGLEVHVHLKTKTKAFCGCSTEFGQEPNSQACPVCLGLPGCLPVLNKVAFAHAIKVALSLNCQVQEYTKFDRKNYFYPDLPKNYQISQYDLPIARDGFLNIDLPPHQLTEGSTKDNNWCGGVDVQVKRVGIRRVHLEEDAGKLIHQQDASLVDFNRAGIPLVEIVSEPDINSPQEAHEYLAVLKSVIEYLEVSDCDMEKGSLRCDANISIRKKGAQGLGVKTELKNMNSFKAVKDALSFEVERQTGLLNKDKPIVQETRLWDARGLKTVSMRTKEEAQDYRYFPEPDLTAFIINEEKIEELKKTLPELPQGKMSRFIKDYALSKYDAKILVSSKNNADYAEDCIRAYPHKDKKPIANWLIGPLLSEANDRNCNLSELKIPGGKQELLKLVESVQAGKLSQLMAKSVLNESIDSGEPCLTIIENKNLFQISDSGSLDNIVEEAIKENAKSVADYKQGKTNALMFMVGEVMRKTSGRANPKLVCEILKRRLNEA